MSQVLAQPAALKHFIGHPEHRKALAACFAGLWALGPLADEASRAAIEAALEHPER